MINEGKQQVASQFLTAPITALLSRADQSCLALQPPLESGGQQQCRTTANFVDRVIQEISFLRENDAEYIGLYLADTYDFAVVLFAVMYAGKSAVILPNIQPGFLNAIEHLDLLVIDDESRLQSAQTEIVGLSACQLSPRLRIHCFDSMAVDSESHFSTIDVAKKFQHIEPLQSNIALFTSGSTGEPQKEVKSWQQLIREVQTLESCWGDHLGFDSHIVATVTHQHIYGLLFKLLWPLATGRTFFSRICHYPEQWLERIRGSMPNHIVLISSPAHLKRAPHIVDLRVSQGRVSCIFSSGGPLSAQAAQYVETETCAPVIEVFGSTETGGVAERRQSIDGDLWRALPSVELESKSCAVDDNRQNGVTCQALQVRSPYSTHAAWYAMNDCVEFSSDGRFRLLGRSDRIVKMEEKRISLNAIEQYLALSPWVQETASVVVEGRRAVLGVVVVLSDTGYQALATQGRKALVLALKTHMQSYVEDVLLPRKWRFVCELPRNSQSKLMPLSLQKMFSTAYQKAKDPFIIAREASNERLELLLQLPPDLAYFDGHFEKTPILPGVAQVHWAIQWGMQFYPDQRFDFQSLKALKFHQFMVPGDKVNFELNAQVKGEQCVLSFSYSHHEKGKLSTGRIIGSLQP